MLPNRVDKMHQNTPNSNRFSVTFSVFDIRGIREQTPGFKKTVPFRILSNTLQYHIGENQVGLKQAIKNKQYTRLMCSQHSFISIFIVSNSYF